MGFRAGKLTHINISKIGNVAETAAIAVTVSIALATATASQPHAQQCEKQ